MLNTPITTALGDYAEEFLKNSKITLNIMPNQGHVLFMSFLVKLDWTSYCSHNVARIINKDAFSRRPTACFVIEIQAHRIRLWNELCHGLVISDSVI